MKVRKAVVARPPMGTRFLPITRTLPRKCAPGGQPLIQFASRIATAGIEKLVMVTAPGKQAIEACFGGAPELESFLEKKGDRERLRRIRELPQMAEVFFVLQSEQLGLGHAVLMAAGAVGREPFALILPDDIIVEEPPALKTMVALYERYNAGIIAVERGSDEATRKYGIIRAEKVADNLYASLTWWRSRSLRRRLPARHRRAVRVRRSLRCP
jgi:UTP--glucose-1-phosphate uridylyltransferase